VTEVFEMVTVFLVEACPSVIVPKSKELGLKLTPPDPDGVGVGAGVLQEASSWQVGFHCPNPLVVCLGLQVHFIPGPHPRASKAGLVVVMQPKLSSHR
jgi:hypothetical protein